VISDYWLRALAAGFGGLGKEDGRPEFEVR